MEELRNMEISYHREMKKNYLMIAVEESREQGFEAKMLIGNTIDGLLKFRIRKTDNRSQFCYEITSRQPLKRFLETKTIDARQIRNLLLGIAQTLTRMEEYLLSEEQILLDPDYIYVDLDTFLPGLCLMPGRKGDFPKEFSELLQFLLDKVDHQDKDAVVLIYSLYRESLKENYGLNDLLRWLMKDDSANLEYGDKEKDKNHEKENEKSHLAESLNVNKRIDSEERISSEITPEKRNRSFSVHRVIGWIFILPVIFLICWLHNGMKSVYLLITSGWPVLIGGGMVSAAGIFYEVLRGKKAPDERIGVGDNSETTDFSADRVEQKKAGKQSADKAVSWEMVFCEEEPEPEEQKVPELEEGTHTVLLWSSDSKEDVRRLVPENHVEEPVLISYYPFLIGKQESLVDYVLQDDTVSRLHVRIDRSGEQYLLTDLNSTNGTSVNGKKLEANEKVILSVGDQVNIANLRFYFQ